MTTVATLTPPDLRLAPGTETRCTVTIHNRGDIVEGYHLQVLGDAANWASVMPPQVQVYPGTEATAEVVFRLAKTSRMYATDVPFAVRVLPMERPEQVVVPEGVLRIGELAEVAGEMLPQTSRTRRTTVHDIAIDNLGNTPTVVQLSVTDPDNSLKLVPRPDRMTIGPGRAVVARVNVRHRKLLWRGQPIARRFQVTAATPDGPGVALDGTSVQQPVFGRWLFVVGAALLALAMVGGGLWFGLLRPAVKSAAEKAGRDAGKDAATSLEAAKNEGPPEAAGGGPSPGASSPGATVTGPPGSGPDAGKPMQAAPVNFQITVTDAPGGNFAQRTVRGGSSNRFTISFIDIMAPQGDIGMIEIYIGSTPWLTHNLANIRDYDRHPTPPIEVPANQTIRVRVNCTEVGQLKVNPATKECFTNVVISGTEYKPAP